VQTIQIYKPEAYHSGIDSISAGNVSAMIKSMTGYGEAQADLDGVSYAVEIKTVNNRYLKTVLKLPEVVAFLEKDIEKLLRNNLARGTVNYTLRLKNVSATAFFEIDEVALQAIMEKLNQLESASGIKGTIDIGSLLGLPGIIRPAFPDTEAAEQIRTVVLDITQQAIEKVKQMRAAEGKFLTADLECNCKAISRDLERIRDRASIVMREYAEKLRKRVNELLAEVKLQLDEPTLAREVAVLADRSDISEELARLDSHLQQFEQTFQENGQVGRRLDFIAQEILREANTIASKASDTEIIQQIVDIKCQTDRIKEQIQNVE
jgi:uncharacterized protein (TIGR00255 family)